MYDPINMRALKTVQSQNVMVKWDLKEMRMFFGPDRFRFTGKTINRTDAHGRVYVEKEMVKI